MKSTIVFIRIFITRGPKYYVYYIFYRVRCFFLQRIFLKKNPSLSCLYFQIYCGRIQTQWRSHLTETTTWFRHLEIIMCHELCNWQCTLYKRSWHCDDSFCYRKCVYLGHCDNRPNKLPLKYVYRHEFLPDLQTKLMGNVSYNCAKSKFCK